jgi:AraC family transcriptional regulator, exoenzyme S synthesis regulatory protein ExsA
MLTSITTSKVRSTNQPFPQKQLMLNGYSAIQYYNGMQQSGSGYTEDIQLIFIKSGTFRMRYANTDFRIAKDQIALLKKNIWIEYPGNCPADVDQLEYIQFTIKYELVKEFTKMMSLPVINREEPLPVIVKNSELGWLSYINSLQPYLVEAGKPEAGLVKIKMLELFFHLSNMDKCMIEQLLDLREHFRTNITATVEDNITNSMSMEQLATLSGRSLSSFRRDFMAIYNMPPSQWIRMRRLDKAKELLLSTTMTVTDICYTLGFENIAHFSRLFKSHVGYPPSDYKVNFLVA